MREFRYFLTKEQAVQLGNYLFTVAGETVSARKRPGFIERFLSK